MTQQAMPTGSPLDVVSGALGVVEQGIGVFESLFGSSGTSGSSTETTSISAEGLQAMLDALLEDETTGLAKVSSGKNTAGLYNSATQTLLLNDLITRAAGQVAGRTATKTTQSTSGASEGILGGTFADDLMGFATDPIGSISDIF